MIRLICAEDQPAKTNHAIDCKMEEIKPVKRSPQLTPLSREHHDGLLFVWKIREGLKNATPVEELRKYMLWYWKEHIKPHFFQEEKILTPYMPQGHLLALRLKEEHAEIRELVITLDHDPDRFTFSVLCNLIREHIRFEERQLFVYLEETLSPEQLNTIFRQLQEHPVSCEEWKDNFWDKKKNDLKHNLGVPPLPESGNKSPTKGSTTDRAEYAL